MSLSKPANFDQAQSIVPCDVCEAESGEHYCTVCKQTLCNECKKHHKKVAATKDHEVVPRVQIPFAVASTSCTQHSDQIVAFQCGHCEVLVCSTCVTDDHQGHRMVKLSKIYKDEKEKVEKETREIEQEIIPSLTKAIKNIQPKREEYQKAIVGIRNKMNDEIDSLKARLDKIHADRLRKLDEEEAGGLKQFDLVQRALEERKRSYTDDVVTCKAQMTSNNQVQFVSYAQTRGAKAHIHKFPVLKFSGPPQLEMVKVENMSELLAKLNISFIPSCTITYKQIVKPKIVSTFKSNSKGLPSICVTADVNAWVGGDESKELRLVNWKGEEFKTRQTKYRPNALGMAMSGDIIFKPRSEDSRTVMKLRADGTECPLLDVSQSASQGVSVTEDGNILVCTAGGCVMRCNGDGGNVRQLYDGKKKNSVLHAIELPDSNICISDVANKALVIIDKNGKVLRHINQPPGVQDISPWGLACDSLGNILLADLKNNRVCIISQGREVRELVGESHGIQAPRWLAVDSEDSLWIAQNDGHVKVVKYLA